MYKNIASQKIAVAAWAGANSEWKTGDAANITAQISKDGGACAATNDVHPTELDAVDAKGIYIFDLTQAETNGDMIVLSPVSSTADITLKPVIIYTQELALFKATGFNTVVPDPAGTAPTAVEIRTEMEDVGSKLTDVKVQTDKMNFTGDDIKSTLDSEEVVTDSASRTASKATGFSVPNEYDTVLSAITVDVAGLNGEAMRGTDNAPTTADIVTGILNGVIEGTLTVKEAQRILLAPLAGKSDGAKTATQHFRNTTDTKNVVTATVDEDGNRTGITLDVSD